MERVWKENNLNLAAEEGVFTDWEQSRETLYIPCEWEQLLQEEGDGCENEQVKPVEKSSSPITTRVSFLVSTPGAFLTLHWYVAVSETLTSEIAMEASPSLGSPVNFSRLEMLGSPYRCVWPPVNDKIWDAEMAVSDVTSSKQVFQPTEPRGKRCPPL